MSDQKISQLTSITGANTADDDVLVIVDTSASQTKKITLGELENALAERDFSFGDNDKLTFGAGSDLQIYHSGSHSFISDQGTGNLYIEGTNLQLQATDGTDYVTCVDNGTVKLYHSGNEKLATTSTGIDVTGTVTADGLTVDGVGTITHDSSSDTYGLTVSASSDAAFSVLSTASPSRIALTTQSNHSTIKAIGGTSSSTLTLQTGAVGSPVDRLLINQFGDISFYEDTGTTAKFFWDASAENLGIGGASTFTSGTNIEVMDANVARLGFTNTSTNGSQWAWFAGTSGQAALYDYDNSRQAMTIDSSGSVGIGTSSPSGKLHAVGNSSNGYAFVSDGTGSILIGGSSAVTGGGITGNNGAIRTAGNLVFTTGGATERLRIDSSGSVGIGTSSPQGELDIQGGAHTTLIIGSGGNTADDVQTLEFRDRYGASGFPNGQVGSYIKQERISSNGKYNLTFGTTDDNAANASERMRITSSGSVGIGTSSPIGKLDVSDGSNPLSIDSSTYNEIQSYNRPLLLNRQGNNVGIGTSSPSSKLAISSGDLTLSSGFKLRWFNDNNYIVGSNTTDHIGFHTNDGSEAMRIDSSGNVGIGTSSPASHLHIYQADGNPAKLTIQNTNGSGFIKADDNLLDIGGDTIRFRNSADTSESMRIDSSGNLLVGKTSASKDTVGAELKSDGRINATMTSASPILANRKTTDGDIAIFQKDNSTVGSIGVNSSDNLRIAGASASHSGVEFSTSQILPLSANALSDNSQNIGSSSFRFKDLYLSGGVYLGGAGSANKLDDYEEGTWTPTLPNGGTLTNNSSTYTKIGNKVTVTTYIASINPTDNASQFRIGGLPFTNVNTPNYYVGGSFGYVGQNNLSDLLPVTGVNLAYIYFHESDGPAASATNSTMRTKGLTGDAADAMILTITYFT